MHFFSDFCVSSVLESSCTRMYTAVLRAVLSCTHIKITIFRGTLKLKFLLAIQFAPEAKPRIQ
jgi:hypothetical protein